MRVRERSAAATAVVQMGGSAEADGVLQLELTCLGDTFHEVRAEGRVIGFVYRAGRVFVALRGERQDWAVECGQSLAWDGATAKLAAAAGLLPRA